VDYPPDPQTTRSLLRKERPPPCPTPRRNRAIRAGRVDYPPRHVVHPDSAPGGVTRRYSCRGTVPTPKRWARATSSWSRRATSSCSRRCRGRRRWSAVVGLDVVAEAAPVAKFSTRCTCLVAPHRSPVPNQRPVRGPPPPTAGRAGHRRRRRDIQASWSRNSCRLKPSGVQLISPIVPPDSRVTRHPVRRPPAGGTGRHHPNGVVAS